jgi:hypothetical protein
LYIIRSRGWIYYRAARSSVRNLDGEGPLSDKALNDGKNERMLTGINEGCNDVLVPEELPWG